MSRTITVKGTGKASARPDLIIITMAIKTLNQDYAKAMEEYSQTIGRLNKALAIVGFAKEDLKTASFSVETEYSSARDRKDNYIRVFDGYAVCNALTLEFSFDTGRLSEVLSAISSANAEPELHISFTVRDVDSLKNEMLRDAAKNARTRAEILCAASGVKLGELQAIDYNWGELDVYSRTSYMKKCSVASDIDDYDIEPEDVDISDTVTFVWEIL